MQIQRSKHVLIYFLTLLYSDPASYGHPHGQHIRYTCNTYSSSHVKERQYRCCAGEMHRNNQNQHAWTVFHTRYFSLSDFFFSGEGIGECAPSSIATSLECSSTSPSGVIYLFPHAQVVIKSSVSCLDHHSLRVGHAWRKELKPKTHKVLSTSFSL